MFGSPPCGAGPPPFGLVPPPLLNLEGPWAVPVTYIPDPLPPCSGNAARVTDSDLNRPTHALCFFTTSPHPIRGPSSPARRILPGTRPGKSMVEPRRGCPPKMEKQVGFADFHLHRVPQNCSMSTSNYLLLRGHHPTDQQLGRDSLGSECSVPGMVDDHGSDVSLEDDYQLPGAELWDSFWQSHLNSRTSTRPTYPALLDSPAKSQQGGHGQGFRMGYENQHRPQGQKYPGEHRRSPSRPAPAPASAPAARRQRYTPPRPPPRASYSIFPPPTSQERRPPSSRCSVSRPDSALQHASRSSLNLPRDNVSGRNTPASLVSRPTSPVRPSRPPSSAATATIRAVPPTPLGSPPVLFPAFQPERPPSSLFKPLPPSPPRSRPPTSRRPSLVNLRNLSLSKLTTTTSPSLAQLSHQHQARPANHQHPLRESALAPRPLPPLPQPQPEPIEPPPHISVFELDDSDTEEGAGGSFARRLMRGLKKGGHHQAKCHQRSASDGRSTPVTAPVATGRARADTVGGATAAGGEGEGRPWLTRQSSEVFERITKGFGGRWSG